MKKNYLSIISFLLVCVLLLSTFIACTDTTNTPENTSSETTADSTEATSAETSETAKTTEASLPESEVTSSETESSESETETSTEEIETTVSEIETTVSEVETTVSEIETTVTNEETTVADVETTVTKEETTVTEVETTVSEVETTVSEEETTVTEVETTVSEIETTVTEVETTVPEVETTVSEVETTVTEEETTVTEEETTSTKVETEETEKDTSPKLEGEHAELIENADKLANNTNVYFDDSSKTALNVENMNMSLSMPLLGSEEQLVTYLKNNKGNVYVENTMDVFVRMKSGNTYYASNGTADAMANIYRLGYYLYDAHYEGFNFLPYLEPVSTKTISLTPKSSKDINNPRVKGDELYLRIDGSDPYIVFKDIDHDATQFKYLELSIKTNFKATNIADVYYKNSDMKAFDDSHKISFSVIPDGEYHTYRILLSAGYGYSGNINGLRLDLHNSTNGSLFTIKDIKLVDVDTSDIPTQLNLARYFYSYSDKLHHLAQFNVSSVLTDIDAVGMLTEVDESKVSRYVIKDKDGLHYDTLDGIDWDSAEYVGFDMTDAGIFGYIIPTGENGGKLEVTLNDGIFSIIQTVTPPNNTINPSEIGTNNANDFYMGQRIYTEADHDLDKFIYEAEVERNPLSAQNIFVDARKDSANFVGYDPLRGFYKFSIAGTGFGDAYYNQPNKHYTLNFSIIGDAKDRNMYIMAYTPSGGLECAVLLDKDGLALPVPLQVGKNFYGDGDQTTFNKDDPSFGETYFPIVLHAGETIEYTLINAYQNWGRYPLKQLSFIQFTQPYYHLSTGVTETNCIIPWSYMGPGLPDHRAMSAPLWADQPQHTLGGWHTFIQYTNADGDLIVSDNVKNTVISYGPTYAEVEMTYLTTDGNIKATYTHMEMPQTDENRGYYTMTYKFLEDITFENFAADFNFYAVTQNGTGSPYEKVGYLDENNQHQVVDSVYVSNAKTQSFVLGDNAPYFDFFCVSDCTNENGYVNLSFLIADWSVKMGGEEVDTRFLLKNEERHLYLSMNMEKAEFKAGDEIYIKAILMPWGSQESIYDGSNGLAPDQNVRDVRENSILDPFKAEVLSNCEVIESAWMPQLRSTTGNNAEFTLSGGSGNVTVRVYGFKKLTAPRFFEKINGKWVEFNVSSAETPDKMGNAHYYDGYMAHYDGDGTFSYSFVTTLEEGESRSFRIIATQTFQGWPEEVVPEEEDPINVYVSPTELEKIIEGKKGVGSFEYIEEDGVKFIRIFGNNTDNEGYVVPYSATTLKETGSYVVVKYRIPRTNAEKLGTFEMFTNTEATSPTGTDFFYIGNLYNDGYWHVAVVDVANLGNETHASFKPSDDGKYYAKFLRIDFFDRKMSEESYIDIAYIGMTNDFTSLFELNKDIKTISLIKNRVVETFYDTATGEIVEDNGIVIEYPSHIHPESEYKKSDVKYVTQIDMINGWGIGDNKKLESIYSLTGAEIACLDYDLKTVNHMELIFSGWTVVDGGVAQYVYSYDDGKTWHAVTGSATPAPTDDYTNVASSRLGGYTFEDLTVTKANACYQGTVGSGASAYGLHADLSACAGQTVNVTFAAVPNNAPDTLCVLIHLVGVEVVDTSVQ